MSAPDFLDLRLVGPISGKALAPVAAQDVQKSDLRQAAEGFEAILIRRLLASAKAGSFAADSPFSGNGVKQFESLRDQNIADLVASRGAFGIADAIERQFATQLARQGDGAGQ